MSRIFKTKSKISIKYHADLWQYLWRRKAKMTRATRHFSRMAQQNSGVRQKVKRTVFFRGYRIFDKLSLRLFQKRRKQDRPLTEIFRNSARLRVFLGGMNKRHLKILFKGFWGSKATLAKIQTAFELIIRCFLLRIHFIRSFREGKYFIHRGFFKVNKKIIFNWNHRVNMGDLVTFTNLRSYEILIYVFFMLRQMISARRVIWGIPSYIFIDWRLLKAKLIRPVEANELIWPHYHIDIFQAVRYTRKNL